MKFFLNFSRKFSKPKSWPLSNASHESYCARIKSIDLFLDFLDFFAILSNFGPFSHLVIIYTIFQKARRKKLQEYAMPAGHAVHANQDISPKKCPKDRFLSQIADFYRSYTKFCMNFYHGQHFTSAITWNRIIPHKLNVR